MYRNVSSLAVATSFPRLRVARFNADRTFSLLSANCASGTLTATTVLYLIEIREDPSDNKRCKYRVRRIKQSRSCLGVRSALIPLQKSLERFS